MSKGLMKNHKSKLNILEIFIPLFCIINQYEIAGIPIGLVCVIVIVCIEFKTCKEFYVYKPLAALFIFMLFHDLIRIFITGFNGGLWIERFFYLLLLSYVAERVNRDNLYRVWQVVGVIVMIGIFYQSFQIYFLGQSVSTINPFPFLSSSSSNYLLKYDRPHSFFLEPASFCTWILPLLCMCMEKKKINWMIIISVSILLSTSSAGIFLTGVIWMFYAIQSVKNNEKSFSILILIGILIIGIGTFINLELFSTALDKLTNISITSTSNSVRLILGYQLFWVAPIAYKFLGIPYLNVENYLRSGEVELGKYQLGLDLPYLGYVNSISNCLLVYGILGVILYLMMFFFIWKETNKNNLCYVLICFISIFGQSVFWNSLFVTQLAVMLSAIKHGSFIMVTLERGESTDFYEQEI